MNKRNAGRRYIQTAMVHAPDDLDPTTKAGLDELKRLFDEKFAEQDDASQCGPQVALRRTLELAKLYRDMPTAGMSGEAQSELQSLLHFSIPWALGALKVGNNSYFVDLWERHARLSLMLGRNTVTGRKLAKSQHQARAGKSDLWRQYGQVIKELIEDGNSYAIAVRKAAQRFHVNERTIRNRTSGL